MLYLRGSLVVIVNVLGVESIMMICNWLGGRVVWRRNLVFVCGVEYKFWLW